MLLTQIRCSNDKLYLSSQEFLESFEIEKNEIKRTKINIKKDDKKNDLFLCCLTPSFSIWIDYYKRDKIHFFERKKLEYFSSFDLQIKSFMPDDNQLSLEEGHPFLRIIPCNDKNYFLLNFKNKKIELYKLVIN